MAEKKEASTTAKGLLFGGMAAGFGVVIATLLATKPAEAATPEEKLNYLIEVLTALVTVLAQVAESNAQLIELLNQWLAAQGVPGVPGIPEVPGVPEVKVTVNTQWVAKEPEQIFSQAIRSDGVFISDVMVDWTKGKRLILKAESSLDQAVSLQPIGNISQTANLATNIGGPVNCPANGNSSIGLAWDDWFPYIGIRITVVLPAPTVGLLNIWAVIQE